MPNIAYTREEYDALLPLWTMVKDCVAGAERIKAKQDTYLPKPNPSDTSAENATRFAQYIERAVFYNVTGRTLAGLTGQVFKKDPVLDLPDHLDELLDDIDGAGVSIWQQSKKVLQDVLSYSRAGLFVDYPPVEGGVTRADMLSGNVRPSITRYDPWDIINWRTRKVGGRNILSLVVLTEEQVTDDDGFEQETDNMWRVLRLDEQNLYVMEEWVNDGTAMEPQYEAVAQYMPTDALGRRLAYIPFTFVGSVNNDPQPDPPLLYDLANLNVAHYRNSADYEESVYLVGQPTPYFAGLTEDWVQNVLKGQIQLGSRAAVPLPENGSAGLLQVAPNTMPFEAMKHKEAQMVAIGAKLLQESKVEKKEIEVVIKDFSEHANLTTVSRNVSDAYETALGFMEAFITGTESEIKFQLNTDFEASKLDANEQAQLVALWQAGAIVETEMRNTLRRAGIAYLDDEEFRDIRETDEPPPLAPAGADLNLQGL